MNENIRSLAEAIFIARQPFLRLPDASSGAAGADRQAKGEIDASIHLAAAFYEKLDAAYPEDPEAEPEPEADEEDTQETAPGAVRIKKASKK